MEIKILGTGCSSCKALYETTKQAVNELNMKATVIKEEDLTVILSYSVMKLPALVLDGKVVSSGKKLSIAEVKKILLSPES